MIPKDANKQIGHIQDTSMDTWEQNAKVDLNNKDDNKLDKFQCRKPKDYFHHHHDHKLDNKIRQTTKKIKLNTAYASRIFIINLKDF